MAKLVLVFNDRVLSSCELEKEYTTIGRSSDNDIVIDNLAVSGYHAQILTILNDSFIEDLDSTNGTYVGGRLIRKHALRNGEEITFGKHKLRYENRESEGEHEFEQTMVIRPDTVGMPEEDASASLPESAHSVIRDAINDQSENERTETQAFLRIISGDNSGRELQLSKALTTIGSPGKQVAAISRRGDDCFLIHVDGGKDNLRPKINEESMGPKSRRLQNNDLIEVAGVKLEFYTA